MHARKVECDGVAVEPASFTGNEYGAYWGAYNGTKAFFESDGTLFVQQAKGVIDVSLWQGTVDWAAAKADGVEGAIIRIGYGAGNPIDTQAKRNVSECKRLGIPFGVYLYSYADTASLGAEEGSDTVRLLKEAGVNPGDLSYPVYYDLEKWTWTGHTPPTNSSVYDGIVNAWWAKLTAAGYNNLAVYSYTSYLNGPLNSSNIHSKTQWVASYGARTGFNYSTNYRGWQYASAGKINGINGDVDMNAFGYRTAVSNSNSGNAIYAVGVGYYVSNSLKGGVDVSFAYEKPEDITSRETGKPTVWILLRFGTVPSVMSEIRQVVALLIQSTCMDVDDGIYVSDWNGAGKDVLMVVRDNRFFVKNNIAGGIAGEMFSFWACGRLSFGWCLGGGWR